MAMRGPEDDGEGTALADCAMRLRGNDQGRDCRREKRAVHTITKRQAASDNGRVQHPYVGDRRECNPVSRDDGFDVMDVSTSIVHDPKFRKLQRHAPDHAGVAFTAYVSVMAESWKAGRRVSLEDSWPAFLPGDPAAIAALVHVGLLDSDGMVPLRAWRGWFDPARKRRKKSRDRWNRYNSKRDHPRTENDADTALVPRGDDADTATSVPPVRSSRPSVRQDGVNEELEQDNGGHVIALVDPRRGRTA
jgi:hypothetical protein